MLLKPVVFIVCLIPLLWLGYDFFTDGLGPEPFTELTQQSGEWTLRILLVTLSMTPLRIFLKATAQANFTWPIKIRRMIGLFVIFYASLHLTTYIWFDQFFDWGEIWLDIKDRPFITLGMLAWLLLWPLTVTSNRYMQRKLGRNWLKLHKTVYLIASLGIVHFFLLVKADYWWPVMYLLIFLSLMAVRSPRLRNLFNVQPI